MVKRDPIKDGENSIFIQMLKSKIKKNQNALLCVVGQTGCQPKDSKILMANGEWKNIQEIKKGDIVLSPQEDGKHEYSKVTDTFNWFSNENYDVYQLNRAKKKLYSCSYNHLIPVLKRVIPIKKGKRNSKDKSWIIGHYTAKEYNKLSNNQNSHTRIGFSSFPIQRFMNIKNCEIEPYSLGVFLGDGMFRDKEGRHDLNITTMDKEIINEVSKYYKIIKIYEKKNCKASTYELGAFSNLGKLLKKYGLNNKKSGNKFIPKEALLSDLEYRKKLLAGLIDTDGYYSKSAYSIVTKSKQLADDILNLVYSIGCRGNITKIKKGIKKLNFVGEYYNISIYCHNLNLPIKTKRKIKDTSTIYLSANRVAITTKKSNSKMVYGFELDSKSKWYVTDNWMVTHNTGKSWAALRLAECVDPNFSVDNVCLDFDSFMKLVKSEKLSKGSAIVVDEAGLVAPSREYYSKQNRVLSYVLQSFRYMNYIVIFTVPDLSFVDVHARRLFHFILRTHKVYTSKGTSLLKPYHFSYPFISSKQASLPKLKFPMFRTEDGYVKLTRIEVRKPSIKLRHAYENKKRKFLDEYYEAHLKPTEKELRQSKPLAEKESFVFSGFKLGLTATEIAQRLQCSKSAVDKAIQRIREKGYEILTSEKK